MTGLQALARAVAECQPGNRNAHFLWATMRAVEEDYSNEDIHAALTAVAIESGLERIETRATIRSGIRKAEREGKRGRLRERLGNGATSYEVWMADPDNRARLEALQAEIDAELATEGAEAARADGLAPEERLARCVATFREWLHFPDPGVLYVILAAVVANRRRSDDPVWPLIVGAPGSGKTEVLGSVSEQADIYQAATLTEAALLSGSPKRERATDASGGLLRQLGDFGIIVCKDFGSVLSMNEMTRGQVLAALREVYDGSWTRLLGTDGGRTLSWSGKVGLIAGCTPTIDSHHAVMGSMGERFVIYRVSTTPDDDRAQSGRALMRLDDDAMRKGLAEAVAPVLAAANGVEMPAVPNHELRGWLVELSTFAVRCRSSVERDSRTREIELIPPPEMPARLALVLWRMYRALRAIGLGEAETRALVMKMALDSMPAIRRAVLEHVATFGTSITSRIADSLGLPRTTATRALEDLNAHGLIEKQSGSAGAATEWWLSDWASDRLAAIRGTRPENQGEVVK